MKQHYIYTQQTALRFQKLHEGPFATRKEAIRFGNAEVGMPWVVLSKPPLYTVQHLYLSGWADAEWTIDDAPARFQTKAAAQASILEHVKDCREAVKAGHMDSAPSRRDYRAVQVIDGV